MKWYLWLILGFIAFALHEGLIAQALKQHRDINSFSIIATSLSPLLLGCLVGLFTRFKSPKSQSQVIN